MLLLLRVCGVGVIGLLSCGCLGLRSDRPPPAWAVDSYNLSPGEKEAKCDDLNSSGTLWGGMAAGGAVVAGGIGGLASLATKKADGTIDADVQLGMGITSLIVGAFSATSTYLASRYGQDFNKAGCGSPPQGSNPPYTVPGSSPGTPGMPGPPAPP